MVAVSVGVEVGVDVEVGVKVRVGVAVGGAGVLLGMIVAVALGVGARKEMAGWHADSSSAITAKTATGDRLDFVVIEDSLLGKMEFRVSRNEVPTGLGLVVRTSNYRQQ